MRTRAIVPCLTAWLCVGSLLPAFGGPEKAVPFDLSQVRLLDGPFQQAQQRDLKYLLSLDPDRLLHNFRVTAGLALVGQAAGRLGIAQWRSPRPQRRPLSFGLRLDVRQHGRRARSRPGPSASSPSWPSVRRPCPGKGVTPASSRPYPESFFDRVDQCKPVWAPYYTLHKIMAGLLDVHQHCGDPPGPGRAGEDGRLAASSASIAFRPSRCSGRWATSTAA